MQAWPTVPNNKAVLNYPGTARVLSCSLCSEPGPSKRMAPGLGSRYRKPVFLCRSVPLHDINADTVVYEFLVSTLRYLDGDCQQLHLEHWVSSWHGTVMD